MKQRILIFSTAYLPHVGGAEIAIKEITKRLEGEFEFDLITARLDSSLPRSEKIGAVTVHRIGFGVPLLDKLMLPVWGAVLTLRLKSKHAYLCFWAVMVTYASGAAFIANLFSRDTPIVLTLQEGDSPAYIQRKSLGLIGLSWRLALRRAHHLTVISTFLGTLARHYGYKGDIVHIPNGVDIGRFSRTFPEAVVNEVRDRLGKKMGDVFLITTSRLVRKNAVDDCLRALTKLPENVHFVVLGVGSEHARLKKMATQLNLEKRVKFVGQVNHEEIPKYLAACDIFIRPSRSEGMGNSFIEAMAAGLPVIATQEGGVADFLFDEKRNPNVPVTGWAVDKDSPEQIAVAVSTLMSNPEKVRAVTRTAKEMVKEKYDWDSIAHDMREKVFSRLFS